MPELTLGWRLRMAREMSGMGLREFAAHIGVAPDTITNAEKDRRKVRPITVNAYALATGVSREWLETGVPPHHDGDGGDSVGEDGFEPPTFRVKEGNVRHLPFRPALATVA